MTLVRYHYAGTIASILEEDDDQLEQFLEWDRCAGRHWQDHDAKIITLAESIDIDHTEAIKINQRLGVPLGYGPATREDNRS